MSKPTLQSAYASLLNRSRLTPNPYQAALITRLTTLQAQLVAPEIDSPAPRGLYIHGSVGTGKSRIADLFSATLPPAVTRRRVHFFEFMMDVHARLHVARSQFGYAGDPLVRIGREVRGESRVLCFDEFQVTDIADAMILKRLFGAIWEAGGVVVSTSNRAPAGLYERGLNRDLFLPFIAELERRCEVWRLEGVEDYRMGKGFSASGSEADRGGNEERSGDGRIAVFFTNAEEFERELSEATGSAEMQPMVIPVLMSRQLEVLAVPSPSLIPVPPHEQLGVRHRTKLIVSSTFEALCQTFLGSADYYALCSTTSTLFLSGLRPFRAHELDFVRRFITLVDLAYEAKTRIVCLSSVPLFEVFANIVPQGMHAGSNENGRVMTVKGEGGSSSSLMSTFIGEMEWSATGLETASLASGGAGETDVGFAVGRAVSRLVEMGWEGYGLRD